MIRVLDRDGTILARDRARPEPRLPAPDRGARVAASASRRATPSCGAANGARSCTCHPVRAQGLRPREHRRARPPVPGLRRPRRHAARAAGRRRPGPPRDGPVAALTAAARDIERTRDPGASHPPAPRRRRGRRAGPDAAGDARRPRGLARRDRGALDRQRQFVADASHELRTPLTSILANLELLAEVLDGERGEAAALGPALLAAHAPPRRRPAAARPRRRQPPAAARADRPRPGPRRGRRRARPGRRRPRPDRRRRRRGRRRRTRRAAPHGPEPDGERDPPHARRARRVHARIDSATARSCSPCRTTAPASRPSCASACSSASSAARATAAPPAGSASSIVRAVAESHGGRVVARGRPSGSALRRAHAAGRQRRLPRSRGGHPIGPSPDPRLRSDCVPERAPDRHRRPAAVVQPAQAPRQPMTHPRVWERKRATRNRVEARVSASELTSDLDNDRQHHRPAAQALVDELGEVVVQHLLQEVGLADLLARGARQRRLDRAADVAEQLVASSG